MIKVPDYVAGYESFRGTQEKAVMAALTGEAMT